MQEAIREQGIKQEELVNTPPLDPKSPEIIEQVAKALEALQ
jgi:hypothetical protein